MLDQVPRKCGILSRLSWRNRAESHGCHYDTKIQKDSQPLEKSCLHQLVRTHMQTTSTDLGKIHLVGGHSEMGTRAQRQALTMSLCSFVQRSQITSSKNNHLPSATAKHAIKAYPAERWACRLYMACSIREFSRDLITDTGVNSQPRDNRKGVAVRTWGGPTCRKATIRHIALHGLLARWITKCNVSPLQPVEEARFKHSLSWQRLNLGD